jgi:pyruvate/2-oxoglutarate dehydrogenase complex dihydrolipoamide dehydrogenase (E3) component
MSHTHASHDDHDRRLESHVRPPDWRDPPARDVYHLVVVGGGPAGLVAAAGAASLGARVALVERQRLGGDCLNVGCVPSKSLIHAARVAATVRDARQGSSHPRHSDQVDFAAIMERMRRLRADMAVHDSAARFRDLGVDVFLGQGVFVDDQTLEVNGQRLRFHRAVIATGARAADGGLAGFTAAGCLTNETIFSLTELPRRLVVLGGGPIGSELAQCFARFGSQVTQLERGPRILPRDDEQAAALVQQALRQDGVEFLSRATVEEVRRREEVREVVYSQGNERRSVEADAVLVALGRMPNIEGLNLEAAGVQSDARRGVHVDDFLRTTNSRIYAAGDVCSRLQFTHAADAQARLVLRNALFGGRGRASRLWIPWCTYTSPEVAHLGPAPEDLARDHRVDTYTVDFRQVDRAVLSGEALGFVRVHVRQGTDRLVAGTIVADNAGDLMGQLSLAATHGLGLRQFASTVYPYPTHAEAFRKLGDQFNRGRLTPWIRRLLAGWMRLRVGRA